MNADLYLDQAEPCANHERFAVIPTNDPCEHAASLRDWSQDYLQLSAGPFSGEIVEASIGPIQIFKEAIHQCVDEKANPRTGSFVMGVPVRMDDGGCWQGRQLNRDSLLTLEQNEELHFRTPQHSEILVTVIDFETLNAFTQNTSGNDVTPLITTSKAKKISPETAQGLRAVLSHLLASISTTPEIYEHEASKKSVVETVLNSALYILQSQSEGSGAPKTTHYVQRSIVERARQYIIERKSNPPQCFGTECPPKDEQTGTAPCLHERPGYQSRNVFALCPASRRPQGPASGRSIRVGEWNRMQVGLLAHGDVLRLLQGSICRTSLNHFA